LVAGPSGWQSGILACCKHWTSWSILTPAGIRKTPCGGRASPPVSSPTLVAQGFQVSDDTVGRLLKQQRYTLQRTLKEVRSFR
jgi:hypothetical protein